MNRRLARKYAHEVFVRAVDSILEDDEWISERFAAEELRTVLGEVSSMRLLHLRASISLPERTGEKSDAASVPSGPPRPATVPPRISTRMIGKRGYSFGDEYPIHYEKVRGRWEVFDARTDEVLDSVEHEWEALDRAHALNGSPTPDLPGIDGTP